ncbi:MAG: endolytic transglycosylase MltG [Bacilli bacterium]|nr:endolytic transglycosylase MltG [Bacilli bacterium]MBR3049732.1 endolytic transglycosylase MltG [Bacilli bacterium]
MAVKKKLKFKYKSFAAILIVLGSFLLLLAGIYSFVGRPMDPSDKNDIIIVIPKGSGVSDIADTLKRKKLIRSKFLFHVAATCTGRRSLKASKYVLNRSMSMNKIIDILHDGNHYNPDHIRITFKEGLRVTDYARKIAAHTTNTYEDVISVLNDKTYTKELINKYWFLDDSILNNDIYYPLEGYLFPDTYEFKSSKISVKEIIEKMLNETNRKLTPYKSTLGNRVHHYITMASIVELEGTNTTNRKMIVGIFNNRLKKNMNLGSDVTTYYALQYPMTSDLTAKQFETVNPYNTRSKTMNGKMPVGPICNPGISSIKASLNPTANDYLFFVADKHGKIYYTKTMAEHDKKVKELKEKGDWIW